MTTYCVYLTIYAGKKLPMFYIGSSTLTKINNGYKGSVSSKEYGKIWKEELKNNPELFKTKILSLHDSREQAFYKEEKLQKKLNVVKNTLYVNKSFANSKFSLKQHSSWTRDKFKTRVPWNKGKTNVYTDATLKKMSTARKGKSRPCSDETKIKLSGPNPLKANIGAKNGMYGKTHTEEVRKKLALIPVKHLKGKSYEEIYGVEKAKKLRQQRSLSTKGKDNSGSKNPRYDANNYHFMNTLTGEIVYCTRTTFMATRPEMKKTSVCEMINNAAEYKNWCVIYSL